MNNSQSARELRDLVARVENLDDQISDLRDDRKVVMAEAKALGFDTKTINAVVKRRRMLPSERAEADILVETYEEALSDWPRALIDGGELRAQLVLEGPVVPSKKTKAMAEALAWASGSVG